jgi:MoaA/NifB/PqqE/SkfB family radical SAM enzyme
VAAAECLLPNGEQVLLENIFELEPSAIENIAPTGACPFLGQEAWISAEGRFNPCCAPDAQRLTLGAFGNLDERSFGEIWNGAEYQRLTATYRNRALCIGCNMRKPGTG